MNTLLLFPKLFLAGGAFLGTLQFPQDIPLDNHTLLGQKIPASQVVTRAHWGTPMLPDGKGGYSLIAPINKKHIAQSLWIPPVSGTRPAAEIAPAASTNSQPPLVTVPGPAVAPSVPSAPKP